ncbi:MAG: CBS domain-containing protein, partial [Candidatus Hodarchaeales archaeon]
VWACGSSDVVVGFSSYTVREVMEVMQTNKFRRLPILGDENELQGIIVISDIIRWLQAGANDIERKIAALMTTKLVTIEVTETVKSAIQIMRENNIGCLPIVVKGARLAGIITERDILSFKGLATDHLSSPVAQFLRDDEFLTASHEATVQDVLDRLVEKNIRRAFLVENNKLMGIVTAADILESFLAAGGEAKNKPVSEVATSDVLFVSPKTPVSAAVALMRQENIGQLPVVDDRTVIGVFTERDILLMLAGK